MSHRLIVHLVFVATCLAVLACSGGRPTRDDALGDGGPGTPTGAGGADDDGGGDKLDVEAGGTGNAPGDEEGECQAGPPPSDATLRGTVLTPNLEIPISGALIYTASTEPEGVPDGVYCAECRKVDCDHRYVLSNPDGSFELPAVSGPDQWLVVTKGEFLHATPIDIAAGDTTLDPVISSLPGEWNPAEGHYIPRMAVMTTEWDQIFNVLAKIGLAEVDALGNYVPGTEQFDVYGDRGATLNPEGQNLLDDLDEMNRYHIIFIPCISQGPLAPNGIDGSPIPPNRIDNIRAWTEAGGKWYVTDWANEYLYEPFPTYQTFHQVGMPDLEPAYDAQATIVDPDLLAWLEALPDPLKDIGAGMPTLFDLPTVTMQASWTGLDQTPAVIVQDAEGMDVDVGHYPWVTGPCASCAPTDERPMTVSARYGCGRMMFSTYHTNEIPHVGLSPQELVLLYIILEIGVCHGEPPPPAPPQG